jgi:hypothetical protein
VSWRDDLLPLQFQPGELTLKRGKIYLPVLRSQLRRGPTSTGMSALHGRGQGALRRGLGCRPSHSRPVSPPLDGFQGSRAVLLANRLHRPPIQVGPVTAKVCVLAKVLRNTRFVESAAPDPQQNQALRPSFPRAPGGEVSRDTIVVRSTVRHNSAQAADQSDLHGRWPFCTPSRSLGPVE